ELIKLHPEIEVEIRKIKTTGDKVLDVPLAKIGGKGLFVKEIEEAMLRGDVDLAVHSMKDVPTVLPSGLHLKAICKREDPRDAFISRKNEKGFIIGNFHDIPEGSVIGTSSLRRSCQLLNQRPDLKIVQLRGNVDTRLRKLDEGQFDAIILAAAGVKRLGWEERITERISPEIMLPAIGQGAIGIECRVDDDFINELVSPLNHRETALCVVAERAFLKCLEGGCQVPIAAYGSLIQDNGREVLVLDGLVGSVDGKTIIRASTSGSPEEAETIGDSLARDLLDRGAREILDEVYGR
ncbi:MAG: hydroxymethylbilane synthase, partial [Nitrospirae bacterium]|nr:hydroxymethylbilane synthase [Nitrospirota bacterium]